MWSVLSSVKFHSKANFVFFLILQVSHSFSLISVGSSGLQITDLAKFLPTLSIISLGTFSSLSLLFYILNWAHSPEFSPLRLLINLCVFSLRTSFPRVNLPIFVHHWSTGDSYRGLILSSSFQCSTETFLVGYFVAFWYIQNNHSFSM